MARPQTTAFGNDAYPDIWTKAAALLHSIVTNHALVDGDKRLGCLTTAVFLEINRASTRSPTGSANSPHDERPKSRDHTRRRDAPRPIS